LQEKFVLFSKKTGTSDCCFRLYGYNRYQNLLEEETVMKKYRLFAAALALLLLCACGLSGEERRERALDELNREAALRPDPAGGGAGGHQRVLGERGFWLPGAS
jgi:hypothetical protein